MSHSYPSVRLHPSQKSLAVEVLSKAFLDDVGYAYVIPDREERERAMRRFWNALLSHCAIYGDVYTTPEVWGIACWLTPGNTSPGLWQLIRTGFALPRAVMSFSREARERIAPVMRYNDDVHSRIVQGPHWYLGALAVDPDHQGMGIGASLLKPVLAMATAQRLPCFLETQTAGNVRFYEKQGFEVKNRGEVPGTGLKMWAMLRMP